MNNDQLLQLKSLGSTPDSELLLLYLLRQYSSQQQNAYIENSELVFLDFDSAKIYKSLAELKQRGAVDFQASSLNINWTNSNEEERFVLQEIQSSLSSGVLTQEQAFYYELLLQKSAGSSQQNIDIYNWTGVEDYTAIDITKLAYEWSLKTTKFTANSNDWLIFWEEDFSSFNGNSTPPTPPVTPPVTPTPPPPTPAPEPQPATLSASGLTIQSLAHNGQLIMNDYVILEITRPNGITDSPAVEVVSGSINYIQPFTPGSYRIRVKFTSGVLITDLGTMTV